MADSQAQALSEIRDRRVERTHRLLRDALLSLLAERSWDEISVRDLCERADIGRSTFYLHFQNKEELLTSGLEGLRGALRRQAGSAGALGFARGLIDHVGEQRRVFRAIAGRRSGHVVQARFREMVEQLVAEDFAPRLPRGWQRDAAVQVLAGSLAGLIAWWVEVGAVPTAEEVEGLFRRLAEGALAQLGGVSV